MPISNHQDAMDAEIKSLRIDRSAIARYGINASQVLDVVESLGGKTVGQVFEGQRRFDMQVRFRQSEREDIGRIRNIKVADPQGRLIPLSQLAMIKVEQGPAQISRENIQRRISIETNVRGRDIASFVAEAQRALAAIRALPEAYRETLVLRLVEGLSGPEIAAVTGLTPESVRVNLHRGFRLLRERLGVST